MASGAGVDAPSRKICVRCSKRFETRSHRQVYCSPECRSGIRTCEGCGKQFVPTKNTTGKYCSPACWHDRARQENWGKDCPVCGTRFYSQAKTCSRACADSLKINPDRRTTCEGCGQPMPYKKGTKADRRFCSRACANENSKVALQNRAHYHPFREEGSTRNAAGGHGYKEIKRGGKWVREHVAVMEEMLGRPLEEFEQVHHKNTIRSDNRPENLELWTHGQPKGGRVDDLIAFVVDNYGVQVLSYIALKERSHDV